MSTRQLIGQPKWQRILLLSVLGYEGAGSLVGGSFLIAAPDGRLMHMPVQIMNGVFNNFHIPGIILFVLGILNSIAFIAVLRRNQSGWLLSEFALGSLFIWFWVEISILQELHWLHAMWGLPVVAGLLAATSLRSGRKQTMQIIFLTYGILASLLYGAMNIFVAMQWNSYDSATMTVSELSAVDAPTRTLWVLLAMLYTLFTIAFGIGVWRSAGQNRHLRIAGILLFIYGILCLVWPFTPMHLREVIAAGGATMSDTLHIALAMASVLIMLLAMGFGAMSFGKGFRVYSIITMVTLLVFGILTSLQAPGVDANTPTPTIGIWERVNIGVFLLWNVILAIFCLRKR